MRRFVLLACGVLSSTLFGLASAAAQAPQALPDGVLTPPSASLPASAEPRPAPLEDPTARRWGLDVLIGVPAGARLFRELGEPGGSAPEIEAFAGLYIIAPLLGGGLRWHFVPWCGASHALVFRPGVDGYALLNPSHTWLDSGPAWLPVVAADADCVWQHRVSERCSFEFGCKLGAALVFSTRTIPLPIGGLFLGVRY